MKQADHLDPTLKLPLTNVTDESNPEDSSVIYNDITNQETFVGESPYYVQYTIAPRNQSDTLISKYSSSFYYYLPLIVSANGSSSFTSFTKIEITKKDGSVTTDYTNTLAEEVHQITLYYPTDSRRVCFLGKDAVDHPCYIRTLESIHTEKFPELSSMFANCSKLEYVNTESFSTSHVTAMRQMFLNCRSLKELDLSYFKTTSLVDITGMLSGCSNLEILDLSGFNISNAYKNDLLLDCSKLAHVGYLYATAKELNQFAALIPSTLHPTIYYHENFTDVAGLTLVDHVIFKKYQQQTLETSFDLKLRRVGDICDSFDLVTGEYVQRIGEVMLDGSQSVNSWWNTTSTIGVGIPIPTMKNISKLNCDKLPVVSCGVINNNTYDKDGIASWDTGNIVRFRIEKSKLATEDIDGVKQYLQQNPITVQYELATPIITKAERRVFDQNELSVDFLRTFRDGKIITLSNTYTPRNIASPGLSDPFTPTLECSLPTSNYFPLLPLKERTAYTIFYQGDVSSIELGGEVYNEVTSPMFITSGATKLLKLNGDPSEVMLFEEDARGQDLSYFTGKVSLSGISITTSGEGQSNTMTLPPTLTLRRKGEVYDEYYPLTSKYIQRIGEDDCVLDVPIESTVECTFTFNPAVLEGGKVIPTRPKTYANGIVKQSNKQNVIFSTILYQAVSKNRYEVPLLEANQDYTIRYDGNASVLDFGGNKQLPINSKSLIRSGSSDKVMIFDQEVEQLVLIKGDQRHQSIPYFKGLESVKMPVLTTTGKNLFDGRFIDGKAISFTTGEYYDNSYMSAFANFIEVRGNTKYIFDLSSAWVIEYDVNKECIGGRQFWDYFTTSEKCKYVKIYIELNKKTDTMQFEEGSKLTTHEPYKSNILTVNEDVELRGVGRVKDELNLLTGELTQRIGEMYFDGSDDEIWNKSGGSTDKLFGGVIDVPDSIISTGNANIYSNRFVGGGEQQAMRVFHYNNHSFRFFVPVANLISNDPAGFKEWLKNNPITIQYELATPIIKTVDLNNSPTNDYNQPLTFKGGHGTIESSTLIPRFEYRLPSKNHYLLSQLKAQTAYTIFANQGPTNLRFGGTTSDYLSPSQVITSGTTDQVLCFNDDAEQVMVIEGDVTRETIPYFLGTLDVVNPTIQIKGSEEQLNTVQTHVTLRSVGEVRDRYDLVTQQLTQRISEDYEILQEPMISRVPIERPISYPSAKVTLSSPTLSLVPFMTYACASANHFRVPLKANVPYTLKFNVAGQGQLVTDVESVQATGNHLITSPKEGEFSFLTEPGLSAQQFMFMRGDVRHIPIPYFNGLQSLTDPILTLSDGREQTNQLMLSATLRSLPSGVCDKLDVITGKLIKRVGERDYEAGDERNDEVLTNGLITLYPLETIIEDKLYLEWSNGVVYAFEPNTYVSSTTTGLKPLLSFKIPTSTIEVLVSILQEKNSELSSQVVVLEEENVSTMMAIAEVFELMVNIMPTNMTTINISASTDAATDQRKGGLQMVEVYVTLIIKGKKTLEQVPAIIRPQVEAQLIELGVLEA